MMDQRVNTTEGTVNCSAIMQTAMNFGTPIRKKQGTLGPKEFTSSSEESLNSSNELEIIGKKKASW